MISIEKITTREGFERLEPVWNPLLEASASNSITLTWEWLTAWWDVFGQGRRLYILVVREGDEVIGIAPLLKRMVWRFGLIPYRRLEFLASGENEADEICSDYLDFILQRGREAEALEAIFGYLHKHKSDWDEIIVTDMSGESPNLRLLQSMCETGGAKCRIIRDQTCLYAPLPDSWDEFLAGLGSEFRRKIRKDRRILESAGGEVRVIDKLDGFESHFEELIRLHQARWTERGETGVFAGEKFTRFHRLLAHKAIPKGWLKLFLVYEAGEAISASYDFAYNGKMYYYQSGFAAGSGQLSSPGALVRSFAIEKAIEMGLSEYDFLKGEQGSYKSRWRCKTRSILQLRVAKPHSKEALYTAAAGIINRLRYVKRALMRYAAF